MVGYADGCTGPCATDPANTSKSVWATIARQSNGLGLFSAYDPQPFSEQNVTSLVGLQVSNTASSSGTTSFNLTIRNNSTQTLHVPLHAAVAQLNSSSGRVTVRNADNSQSSVGAFWDYSNNLGSDNLLSAGETSSGRTLSFNNPNNESFTVTFSVTASAPYSGPTCCAPTSNSAGGGSSAGSNGTSGTSPSVNSTTTLVYQLTYNPLLRSVTVRLIGQ
jgi:hypothetical protein